MDYLKLLKSLNENFAKANCKKYQSMKTFPKIIFTLLFIPFRVSFILGGLFYWFTWFFFRAIAAPVDYLGIWFENQKESLGDIPMAVLYLICMPVIFLQHIVLAFTSFAFFFQWFGLMLQAYIMTLGAIKWQPVITEVSFDEE